LFNDDKEEGEGGIAWNSFIEDNDDDLAPLVSSTEMELDLPPKRHRRGSKVWQCGKISSSIALTGVLAIPFLFGFLFNDGKTAHQLSTFCETQKFAELLQDMRTKEDYDMGLCEDSLVSENVVMFCCCTPRINVLLTV
jgi:hypothetical protein